MRADDRSLVSSPPGLNLAISVAVTCSGGAALGYEICWSRALVVPLGNSTDATTLVLTTFMLGMAAGAWVAGRWAERARSALVLYALLELGLGLFALGAPGLFGSLSQIPATLGAMGSIPWGVPLRYASATAIVLIPCLAMGASLPLVVRSLTGPGVPVGAKISIVYGLNTSGAAAGACWAGFWGMAELGVRKCSAVLASASFAAALLALLVALPARRRIDAWVVRRRRTNGLRASQRRDRSAATPGVCGPVRGRSVAPASARVFALWAAFAGGFLMLACEVVWARVLTFVFGHDTYAFAALLAIVLCGLALGGFVHRLVRSMDQLHLVGALLASFGGCLGLSFWAGSALVIHQGRDPFALGAVGTLSGSVWLELYRELSYTPVLVLPPSILAGALFPAACSLYAGGAADTGRKVGAVGLVNGIGSAAGTLAAALGAISVLGIQGAVIGLGLVASAVAVGGLLAEVRTAPLMARAWTIGPLLLTAGVLGRLPGALPEKVLLSVVGPRHQRLLHYEEARTSTVAVIENQINGERQLLINAVNEVTTRLVHDQSFKLLGHLGPLLHPQPRTAVMICLGAGLSAGAALTHPLGKLDVVDLSSAVSRAARHFTVENNGVLDDPRFRLHTEDGRQFLLNSAEAYDLAIVDSTHPKSVDSWILYTREFYQLVYDRLAEGGVVVQWLPLHGLSEREFKLIVRTFLGVFEHMTLWANAGFETYGQVAYAKLVASKSGPLAIHPAELAARLAEPRIHRDLAPYGMDSVPELLDSFVAGSSALGQWTQGLPEQTDDRPLVPYTTALSRGRRMTPALLLAVRSTVEPWFDRARPGVSRANGDRARPGDPLADLDLARAHEAQGLVLSGNLQRASELYPEGSKLRLFLAQARMTVPYYTSLARRYPSSPERLFEAGTQLGALGHPWEAKPIYQQALRLRPRDESLRLNYALLLLGLGEVDQAIAGLDELRRERPGFGLVLANLGAALMEKRDAEAARALYRESLAWDPESLGTRLALAEAHLALGELGRAEHELDDVLVRNPWIAEAHDLLGLSAAGRGQWELATRHHRRALGLDPYRSSFYSHLGHALGALHAWKEAAGAFGTSLRLKPDAPAVLAELSHVYLAEQDWDLAMETSLSALDLDPSLGQAALSLGRALLGRRSFEEAAQAFCRALGSTATRSAARRELVELALGADYCGE